MSIITNARALRDGYLPEELKHRHDNLDHLTTSLSPSVATEIGADVRIVGPSGTGKTTLAKYALEELEREILELRWGYVSCLQDSSGNSALAQLVRSLGLGGARPEGTPRSQFFDRIRDCEVPVIAIIDEVNMLADPSILAGLDELRNVSLICICIDEDAWLAHLDGRLRSRFQAAYAVRLSRYDHEQMLDILWGRVDAGLRSHRVDPDAIDHIADLSAGDARHGITLLRQAALRVDHDDSARRITRDLVDAARTDAHSEIRQRYVEQLSTHKRLLYELIAETGEIGCSTLHARYEDRVGDPRSRSMRRRYLDRLEEYDLIEQDGEGRGTVYRQIA